MGMKPYIVSLGAQKSFAEFAKDIGERWEKHNAEFNDLYFKELIAKAILFRYLDRAVMKQLWYGGYKANIVTYAIAKLAHMVESIGAKLDLMGIWNRQGLTPATEAQLLEIAAEVNREIQNTPPIVTNVTEWCKKEACWTEVKKLDIPLGDDLRSELISNEEARYIEDDAEYIQRISNGIENQKYVFEKGADYWKRVAKWGVDNKLFSPKQMGVIAIACQIPYKVPSDKQSNIIVKLEDMVKSDGFFEE